MNDYTKDLAKLFGWGLLGQKLGIPVGKTITNFVQAITREHERLIVENRNLKQTIAKLIHEKEATISSTTYTSQQYIPTQGLENLTLVQKKLESVLKKPSHKGPISKETTSLKWFNIMPKNIRCVIVGAPGSGKSATGYMLLEFYRWKFHPYVLGFPEDKKNLLPEWIGIAASFEEVPPNSIILVDEAYLLYHSRRSGFDKSIQEMTKGIGLARQRGHNIIFVSHEARHLDKNIVGYTNMFIIKDPGVMQIEFERREISDLIGRAKKALQNVSGNIKKWAYIFSPERTFEGLLETPLPSFWSEELSHAYASGISILSKRTPKKQLKEYEKAEARRLRGAGWSFGKIAEMLGKSKGTIYNWLTKIG